MPTKPSPQSLKTCALKEVSLHCEWICYGYKKGSKELAKYIHNEGFLEVDGPFKDWPPSLLDELAHNIYKTRQDKDKPLQPFYGQFFPLLGLVSDTFSI